MRCGQHSLKTLGSRKRRRRLNTWAGGRGGRPGFGVDATARSNYPCQSRLEGAFIPTFCCKAEKLSGCGESWKKEARVYGLYATTNVSLQTYLSLLFIPRFGVWFLRPFPTLQTGLSLHRVSLCPQHLQLSMLFLDILHALVCRFADVGRYWRGAVRLA